MNLLSQKATAAASPLLVLFAFALPLSTSAASILAILLVLVWVAGGNKKEKCKEILHNPVSIAVLLYLLLHLIGLLWSEDLDWGLQILKKQWKLLLFPVFLTLVQKNHTKYYLAAFVTAIFILACKAYLVWIGVIALPPGSIFTTEGTTHVTYNPMLALAIYIVLQSLLFRQNRPIVKGIEIILILFLSCNMFITVGRTGQAVFFVLLAVVLFQIFYSRSKKMLITGLILLPLLVAAIFQFSPTFRNRINTTVTEIQNSASGKITSMGCRLSFCQNTFLLLEDNWLIGTGTGDFPGEYAKINQIHSPNMPNTDNPHNQYLLVISQFGIFGLVSLLAIFISQLFAAFTTKDFLTPLRQAFPIFFLVIMLGESYLQVYQTGFLFSLFSSFLFKDFSNSERIAG